MTAVILPFRHPYGLVGLPGAMPPPELPNTYRARMPAPTPAGPLPLARPPRELTPEEAKLQAQLLDAHFLGTRAAKNHSPKGIARDRIYVEEFLAFVGQPLWLCTEHDFNSWAGHLGYERLLAPKSQRTMQTAVAVFWDDIMQMVDCQNWVQAFAGTRIQEVVTRENRVTHTCDNTPVRERAFLGAGEFDQFFSLIDLIIEVAAIERPRLLKAFQRDRAMFYAYYAYGLRLSEGQRLNVSSFSRNEDLPDLGNFGCVGVFGKGSNGSGPKYRTVPTVLPDIAPVLTWYLTEIRPKFKDNTGKERAMWLSEYGNRLCRAAIAARYKRLLKACGMNDRLFSMHGLRHMHVSHQQIAGVPLQFTSKTVGHSQTSTTEIYTHLPDDFLRNVAVNIVRSTSTLTNDEDESHD